MIFNKLCSGIVFFKKFGFKNFLYRFLNYLFDIPDPVSLKKQKVLDNLLIKYNSRVKYGPFKNLILDKDSWWAKFDLISQILGTYEENVVNYVLSKREETKELFVNIGAADGYFAVGFAFSGLFENIYAYEISRDARNKIRENAIRNNCINKINIKNEANIYSFMEIEKSFKSGMILIDIEGSEYDLLDQKMFSILKNFHLIVEMHPFLVNDGFLKNERLLLDAKKYFNVDISFRKNYSPCKFKELAKFSEDEQLLALSEGRSEKTEWLLLSPKN